MIAITGGIGSGKSIVSRFFRLNGFGVFDCDFEAKKIMNGQDLEVRRRIETILGDRVYENDNLDRIKVAEIIFNDEKKRGELNRYIHREVLDRLEEWSGEDTRNKFVECAVPGESGLLGKVKAVIEVKAPVHVRIERVIARDGHTPEHIQKIMKAQMREEELLLKSGKEIITVDNDGEESLFAQLNNIILKY